MEVINRWAAKITRLPNGCWEWTGFARRVKGIPYLVFMIAGHTRNPRYVSWYINHDDVPARFLRASCENSLCVAPDHIISTNRIDEAQASACKLPPGHIPWNKGKKGYKLK
jgi:hypothetical protein